MRFRKFVVAAILAVVMYIIAPLVTAPLVNSGNSSTSVITGGVVYADGASDACASKSDPVACADGYRGHQANKSFDEVCKNYQGGANDTCRIGYDLAPVLVSSSTTTTTTSSSPQAKDCDQGTFTWLLCPLIGNIADFISGAAKGLLSQFLSVEPLKFSGPIYDTWNSIRTLSNVAFVIIFLVMIFSATTRMGVSTYSYKKILPRVVAAAILVQASFVISALIIDAGNAAGAGISSIIGSVAQTGNSVQSTGAVIENLVTILGLGVAVSLTLVAWPFAVPGILMLLISVLSAITVLAVRYLLIGLLTIISPLAFIAWVLPSTERYFQRWYTAFIKLILMYPIIILLLSIAGNVNALIPNMADAGGVGGSIGQSLASLIIKILVLVAAFGAITQTFKWAGGAMAMAHGRISNLNQLGQKAVKKSERAEEAKYRIRQRQAKVGDGLDNAINKINKGKTPASRAARGLMLDAGGLLLAGRGSTSLRARANDREALVDNYAGKISKMRGGNDMMNQRNALMYGLATNDTDREKYLGRLRANNAEAMTDFTHSYEGRQAIMRKLADNNLTGPEIPNFLQKSALENPAKFAQDARNFGMENGKNMPKVPGAFARHTRPPEQGKLNVLGVQAKLMDIDQDLALGFYASMPPEALKDNDTKLDNWKLASNNKYDSSDRDRDISRQQSRIFFDGISESLTFGFDYDRDKRNFLGPDKRAETLIAFARNGADVRATDGGLYAYDEVLRLVAAHPDRHRDAINIIKREEQKSAAAGHPEDLLGSIGLAHLR